MGALFLGFASTGSSKRLRRRASSPPSRRRSRGPARASCRCPDACGGRPRSPARTARRSLPSRPAHACRGEPCRTNCPAPGRRTTAPPASRWPAPARRSRHRRCRRRLHSKAAAQLRAPALSVEHFCPTCALSGSIWDSLHRFRLGGRDRGADFVQLIQDSCQVGEWVEPTSRLLLERTLSKWAPSSPPAPRTAWRRSRPSSGA